MAEMRLLMNSSTPVRPPYHDVPYLRLTFHLSKILPTKQHPCVPYCSLGRTCRQRSLERLGRRRVEQLFEEQSRGVGEWIHRGYV